MPLPPTQAEIRTVAHKAVDIFRAYQLKCCLFGSAACALYGTTRVPNDVDIIVLTTQYDQEELKQLLVADEEAGFYTVPSRSRRANYEVLWCTLPSRGRDIDERACKVDILVPGVLNIPFIPARRLVMLRMLPVLPLSALLLLKLQGWSDHRDSDRPDFQEKQYTDVEDISELLSIACDKGLDIAAAQWLPEDFMGAAEIRVVEFVEEYNDTYVYWRDLGFDVD